MSRCKMSPAESGQGREGRRRNTGSAGELRISVVDSIGAGERGRLGRLRQSTADRSGEIRPPSAQSESELSTSSSPADQNSVQISDYNPFVSHDFLSALEESKSVGGRSGWQSQHVLAKTADGTRAAARALLPQEPFARRIRVRRAAGPKPMSAPAAAITRNCRSRCRSRRRPAPASGARPGPDAAIAPRARAAA